MDLNHFNNTVKQFPNELRYIIQISGASQVNPAFVEVPHNFRWDRFIMLVQQHQLTSLVFPYLSARKDQIPETFYGKIKSIHYRNTRKALAHVEQTIHLQSLFSRNKIPALFIKGVVLSQMLYNDPALKNSIDIDILVPFEQIGQTAGLLNEQGYRMTYPEISLTNRQKKINYKISHHYEFRHPEKGVRVELHWKLVNPHRLLPLTFDRLYSRACQVNLQDHPINTLSGDDYMLYLAVHGARHRWYNLAWLKDFSRMLEQTGEEDTLKVFKKSSILKVERCFIQGCLLSELIYGMKVPESIRSDYERVSHLTEYALKTISRGRPEPGANKIKNLFYLFRLRKSVRYQLTLIFRLRTHHSDWAKIKLPGYLFFLYYPLRPVLWLMGRMVKPDNKTPNKKRLTKKE